MKVEILSKFRHLGDIFTPGEIREVDDYLGEYFCRAGWVKDTLGVVATETPGVNDTVLLVDSIKHNTKAGDV